MKGLLLLVALAIGAYCAYQFLLPEPPPPPAPPPVVAAKPEPVNFAIRSRVRKLFEEWKRRNLGNPIVEHGAPAIVPASEFNQIRKSLYAEGIYAGDAVRDVVVRSLRELGVAEREIGEVSDGILGLK